MDKIRLKILQGSVDTQIVLGGLTMHHPVASFLQSICAKNYENLLRADKVIAMKAVLSFFGPLGITAMAFLYWGMPNLHI